MHNTAAPTFNVGLLLLNMSIGTEFWPLTIKLPPDEVTMAHAAIMRTIVLASYDPQFISIAPTINTTVVEGVLFSYKLAVEAFDAKELVQLRHDHR